MSDDVGALILRYQELDTSLRGLAVAGDMLPEQLVTERDDVVRRLKALGVDPAAGGEDVFGTLSDAEPVVSALPVSKPPS